MAKARRCVSEKLCQRAAQCGNGALLPARTHRCNLLAVRKQGQGSFLAVLPLLLRRPACGDDLRPANQLIVLVLGSWRDDCAGELLVALQAIRQLVPAVLPHAVAVVVPDRSRRRTLEHTAQNASMQRGAMSNES